MKKVIITGGGFAGITAGLKLLKNNFSVTMFNPRAVFEFSPLLPDALIKNNRNLAVFSYEPLLKYKNFELIAEKIIKIDPTNKTITGEKATFPYDYLLIATGLDGRMPIDGGMENSILFKTVADVEKLSVYLKNKINSNLPITINVIGAGATGIEIALALTAYLKSKTKKWQINLFHNQPAPMGNNPAWLAEALVKTLKKQGINFMPNESIARLCPDGVMCGQDLHEGELNILTAGGMPNTSFAPKNILNERGFVAVDEFLQSPDKIIFAAGDVNCSPNIKTAQAAEYEGKLCADNIIATIHNQKMSQNNFKMRGFLIMTGKGTALGTALNFKVGGRIAGLLRLIAYFKSLPGFDNRLKLLKNI